MNRAAFYAHLRQSLFRRIKRAQVDGTEAILNEIDANGADLGQAAYILSTAYNETGGAMQPVRENMNYSARRMMQVWPSRFSGYSHAKSFVGDPRGLANHVYNGRLGNRKGTDDGWNFRGGLIGQITGRANYAKWSRGLGIDLIGNPELLNDLDIAAKSLVRPMLEGWATGLALPDFVRGDKRDYVGARKVWNGTFEAEKYAETARVFEAALEAAGFTQARKRTQEPQPTQPTTREPSSLFTALLDALKRILAALKGGKA